jgi:hypothetical protein
MAFGARGKARALAHYEPANKVINMTKYGGAGSLAHEWGHALDNIMQQYSTGSAGSLSLASDAVTAGNFGDKDPKLTELYTNLVNAMLKPPPSGKSGVKKITLDSSKKSLTYHYPTLTNDLKNGMSPEEAYATYHKKWSEEFDKKIADWSDPNHRFAVMFSQKSRVWAANRV